MNDRREQVAGFLMARDMIGLDAIDSGRYRGDIVALEDGNICGIPYFAFEKLTQDVPALERHFSGAMIAARAKQNHGIMLLLPAMPAEERVAAFLLRFSMRLAAIGRSATHFTLPMAKRDIGSYLGLRLETVCRAFHQLTEMEPYFNVGQRGGDQVSCAIAANDRRLQDAAVIALVSTTSVVLT